MSDDQTIRPNQEQASSTEREQEIKRRFGKDDQVPLVSKLGSCSRCGFHFVVMCSMNDTSAPCPQCENAVEVTLV